MNNLLRIRILRRWQQKRARLERRRLRDMSNVLEIPDAQFIQFYRLNKSLFLALCDKLYPIIIPAQRSSGIPFQFKVLSALSFLATGSYQEIVGNDGAISMSQASVSRNLHIVIDAINNVMCRHIRFPASRQERDQIKLQFNRKFEMPGIIGCVGGTQVAILGPRGHPNEGGYYCRNGYHSINATLVCDSDLKIIAVNAKFGGAADDSHVWRNMNISSYVEDIYLNGEEGWLLGDSGYPQRGWLMTPILHADEGSAEAFYTKKHCAAHNCVERCIGVLKARWRCLSHHRALHYPPNVAGKIINACCVLHNMCTDANLASPEIVQEIGRGSSAEMDQETVQHNTINDNDVLMGVRARAEYVQVLWQSR